MKIDLTFGIDKKFDLMMWWGIVSLLAFLIFSTAIGQALSFLIILVGFYKIFKEKINLTIKHPIILPFVIFIGIRVLSIIFSEYPSISLISLNKDIFFNLILLVFVILLSPYDQKKIQFLIKVLIIAAIIASIIGISKVLFGLSERAVSTTSGYSTLGLFLSVIFAIVFALGQSTEFFPSRWWWFITLIIIGIGILFTFNRINWISIGIVTLIIGLYKERIVLLWLTIIFALTFLLFPDLAVRFEQMIHFTQNMSDRDIIWRGALLIWDQHPFLGFGTRTFHEIFPLFDQLIDKGVGGWHNEYLHIYFESGLLGLISYLWLLISIFYMGVKVLKLNSPQKDRFVLILALLSGFSVFYLSAITAGFILDPITKILFFFLLALEVFLIGGKKCGNSESNKETQVLLN
jgi:O-antigen ligase